MLLKKIFDDYAKLAAHFRNDINIQVIELVNNSMCCLTNKRKFYRESNAERIDVSLVKLELGESGLALMMVDAGNPISEHSIMLLQKMDTEKEDSKEEETVVFYKTKVEFRQIITSDPSRLSLHGRCFVSSRIN